MADWCPSPEERAIVIGIAVTFVYAIDAFANSKSALYQFSHQALPRAAHPPLSLLSYLCGFFFLLSSHPPLCATR